MDSVFALRVCRCQSGDAGRVKEGLHMQDDDICGVKARSERNDNGVSVGESICESMTINKLPIEERRIQHNFHILQRSFGNRVAVNIEFTYRNLRVYYAQSRKPKDIALISDIFTLWVFGMLKRTTLNIFNF